MEDTKKPKKFTLNRQTIKKLQDETLAEVVGGNTNQKVINRSVIVFEVAGAAGRYSCFYACATE